MTKLSFDRTILIWFFIAGVILLTLSLMFASAHRKIEAQNALVEHTYLVEDQLEQTYSLLRGALTEQRGYVITKGADYKQRYLALAADVRQTIHGLKQLVADNPVQSARMANLEKTVAQRFATMDKVDDLFEQEGFDAAAKLVASGIGLQEMENVKRLVDILKQEEQSLLGQRQQRLNESVDLISYLCMAGFGFCVVILIGLFLLIRRETRKRNAAESSLAITLADARLLQQQTNLLGKLVDQLQSCQDQQEAQTVIETYLPLILSAGAGAIYFFNNSRNLMVKAGSWGGRGVNVSEFLPSECWALRRGKINVSGKASIDVDCAHAGVPDEELELCVPMQAHGETYGVLCLNVPAGFMDQERNSDLVRTVGEQISLSISNLRLQERLRSQSVRDPLTQLFNRRYMEETLEREGSRAARNKTPFTILYMDIDHFKKFNDTHGHDAGDQLLVKFANMLAAMFRNEDVACRYGGEEFVVVLPGMGLEPAVKKCEELLAATKALRITIGSVTAPTVSVSIGVASSPDSSVRLTDLIHNADQALYEAKRAGRDQYQISKN